ncbi:MAG: hypothetical protein ACKO96_43050 [Flammeovirgaceae bacterium]
MTKHLYLTISLIFLFVVISSRLHAQKRSQLSPEIVIDKFISRIGGDKWLSLQSRKEYASVRYENDKNSILNTKNSDRILASMSVGFSIELHTGVTGTNSILVYKPDCNWYYSGGSQIVKFFGPESIKFKTRFPRTELMEILNLEPMKEVVIEDTLYKVNFIDTRQLDGKQSLFFGVKSGLLYKRTMRSKTNVLWEYNFDDYTESKGFYEPYVVSLKGDGKDFLKLEIKSIFYNEKIDPAIFDPPVRCKNYDDFTYLDFPYKIEIK